MKQIFTINASLLRKLKSEIPSHTFPMETIPLVFDEVVSCLWKWKYLITQTFEVYYGGVWEIPSNVICCSNCACTKVVKIMFPYWSVTSDLECGSFYTCVMKNYLYIIHAWSVPFFEHVEHAENDWFQVGPGK